MTLPLRRRAVTAAAALSTGLVVLLPTAAGAHSLDSSTLSVVVGDDSVDATVSVAPETVDEVLGTDYATATDVEERADELAAYLSADPSSFTLTYDAIIESDTTRPWSC